MEKTNTKAQVAQGAENATKKQNASKSGTVRSLATVVKNLRETKLITPEQDKTLVEIYKEVVQKWMATETQI